MVEEQHRLVQHHPPDHLVHGVEGQGDGDHRQAGEEEQEVQLEQGDALQLENLYKAGDAGLFRGVFFDAGAGLFFIVIF